MCIIQSLNKSCVPLILLQHNIHIQFRVSADECGVSAVKLVQIKATLHAFPQLALNSEKLGVWACFSVPVLEIFCQQRREGGIEGKEIQGIKKKKKPHPTNCLLVERFFLLKMTQFWQSIQKKFLRQLSKRHVESEFPNCLQLLKSTVTLPVWYINSNSADVPHYIAILLSLRCSSLNLMSKRVRRRTMQVLQQS